jgi:hypothetical protein
LHNNSKLSKLSSLRPSAAASAVLRHQLMLVFKCTPVADGKYGNTNACTFVSEANAAKRHNSTGSTVGLEPLTVPTTNPPACMNTVAAHDGESLGQQPVIHLPQRSAYHAR